MTPYALNGKLRAHICIRHNPDEGNVFTRATFYFLNLRLEVGKLMFLGLTFSAYFARKEDFQCNVSDRIGHQVPTHTARAPAFADHSLTLLIYFNKFFLFCQNIFFLV